jgi:hypothetical protein
MSPTMLRWRHSSSSICRMRRRSSASETDFQ